MPTLEVLPRSTPEERADAPVPVDVEGTLADLAETVETWTEHRQGWEFTLHEGHDFGRVNNVEGRVLYVSGDHSCSVVFRLDQLDACDDTAGALVMRFEERDGIAKLVTCTPNGFDVELFHILTFT
jgi:hypothetical protein